jgi:hypothetical protein
MATMRLWAAAAAIAQSSFLFGYHTAALNACLKVPRLLPRCLPVTD